MKQLPYADSKATPSAAQERIKNALKKFGVSAISFEEDFEKSIITLRFKYKDYPVSIPIDHGALAKAYMERDPWTTSRHRTMKKWKERYTNTAYRASFTMLENYIKPMLLMAETGLFSFEEIFISFFVDRDGKRLGEEFKRCMPEWVSGQRALTEG